MVFNPRCDIWNYFDNIIEEGVAVCKLCKIRLKNERSYSLRKHINKLHTPNSEVWKHFDNRVDEGIAVCKLCNKHVRNNRHFNLMLHLKQHNINVESNNTKKPKTKIWNAKKLIDFEGKLIIEIAEKTVVEAVMGLMIDEGVPPKLFDSKNMQTLLSPICVAISNQGNMEFNVNEVKNEKVICSVANYIRNEISNDLHRRLLSLKIDMDLNASLNTFSVSVQYVNETKVESFLLGTVTLEENHQLTGERIIEILQKFNIDSNQIVSAYWDNSKSKLKHTVTNSEYLREIQKFEKCSDMYVGNIKVDRYTGVIAQLSILAIFKNPSILTPFLECRNLTKFINDQSNIFQKLFEQNNLKIPQLDSPWQWGSTYTMINDLREALPVLECIKYEQPESPDDRFNFNDNLKNFIDAFCKSIIFLQKALQKFYTSEIIFGDFYAQWLKCKLATQKLLHANHAEGNLTAVIATELLKCVENNSEELLNQDHFKACLYLDPRLQHILNLPEKMFALEYLKQLWNRFKLYNSEIVDPVSEAEKQYTVQQHVDEDDDENAFLNEFLCQSAQETVSTGIYRKLEDLKLPFQMADTNVLGFWKDYKSQEPEIYLLSTICFAIPATQIYDKINYSHVRKTSNMPLNLQENLDLIRLNKQILNKAVNNLSLFREDGLSHIE